MLGGNLHWCLKTTWSFRNHTLNHMSISTSATATSLLPWQFYDALLCNFNCKSSPWQSWHAALQGGLVGSTEFTNGEPKTPLHQIARGGKGHRRSISQAPDPLPKTDPWRKETGWNLSGCLSSRKPSLVSMMYITPPKHLCWPQTFAKPVIKQC